MRPPPAGVLPAPLYILEEGQVVKIEVDGVSKTTLTNEPSIGGGALAIVGLSVSPLDSALAYVIQVAEGNTLVLTDANGENRRALLENVSVSQPHWSPDGSAIAVAIWESQEGDSVWDGGIWTVSAISGEARLLLANDPYPQNPETEAWGYSPLAWSPDGSKLLLGRYSLTVETGDVAILDVASGALTLFQPPADAAQHLRVGSSGGLWTPDGNAVHAILHSPGLAPPEPGAYLADATNGMLTPTIPTRNAAGQFIVVQSQFYGADGAHYALISEVDQLLAPGEDPAAGPPEVALYRIGADGTRTAVHDQRFALFGRPTPAPDGSGILIPTATPEYDVSYWYVPIEGEATEVTFAPTADVYWGNP
ncbi:MAG: hypothetical protein HC822_20005 [Oscillochloris sp.]|nr:hypothetical protein [Oscillochloris sp.]